MEIRVVPIIVGALGTVTLKSSLEDLKMIIRIESMQTMALLGFAET